MKKFEVNKKYYTSSPCDHNCVWIFTVIKRTEKFVTLEDNFGKVKRCKVHEWRGVENCYPLGSYSMCPVLEATEEV